MAPMKIQLSWVIVSALGLTYLHAYPRTIMEILLHLNLVNGILRFCVQLESRSLWGRQSEDKR